jgi:hypothetical protein
VTDDHETQRAGSTRRRVLAAAAAGGAAVAGCTSTLPPLGQRVRFGRIDVPSPGPPDYRRWVPAAPALPDSAPTGVQSVDPGALPGGSIGRGLFASRLDWLGTPFESFELAVNVGSAVALEGPTNPATVAGALETTGYTPAGEYEGYDLYTRLDVPRTIAAGDGAAVIAYGETRRKTIRALVDARDGRVGRRHETDDAFATLSGEAGLADFTVFDSLGIVERSVSGALLSSTSLAYADEASYFQYQYLFPRAASVPRRGIRRELRASEIALDADAVDIRSAGRRAVVDVRTDPPTETRPAPVVTWGVDYDAREPSVTIGHEAGTPVNAAALSVRIGTVDEVSGLPDDPDGPQFSEEYDVVEPGDTLRLPADEDDELLRVQYRHADQRTSALLSYNLP